MYLEVLNLSYVTIIGKGRGPWADVASGDETHWEARYLPVGDPSNANIVTCNAEVTDSLGAIGTYPIENVTVE